ncbi:MAG: sulfur oxidation c-type cytochrome SoxA [Herminiimonas sp.]|nr:sulfur oxidation c-type cytochrome SoxA [Herminiimonas sp.]
MTGRSPWDRLGVSGPVRALLLFAVVAFDCAGAARAAEAATPPDLRRSGAEFMSASTRAMQRDDSLNPGMLWVKDGEALWQAGAGAHSNGSAGITVGSTVGSTASSQSCASCHGDAARSMRGVAARYPAFDDALQRPLTLAGRINQCRQKRQHAQPWRAESAELLSMESYVAFQSRAMPIAPPADARLQPYQERGRQRYLQRLGQLDLSCAQCHDQRAGLRLGSSLIPQAHPGGYPVYRLEWQGVGSLERRLRNCMSGVRAESFAYGSVELVELQLYLAARARGMPLEAPGVRP